MYEEYYVMHAYPSGQIGVNVTKRKNIGVLIGFVLAVSLLAASLTAFFLSGCYRRIQFQALGDICQRIIESRPEAEQAVLAAVKEYRNGYAAPSEGNILQAYGYSHRNFPYPAGITASFFTAAGFLTGGILLLLTVLFCHKKDIARIRNLTDYLERVNTGNGGIMFQAGEDDFSKLQDELYKTVTELYQTREAALKAKRNYADNLYNIAHQIKTPLTSISLSAQMIQEDPYGNLEHIRQQIVRLTHLEEALLLLARIDAGTLSMERKEVDVFTLLMLAADNLQELFARAEVSVQIPEAGEVTAWADMEWTMEAIMNLLKNCMEHTPSGGCVYCSYEQNPLYTQIRVWDTGAGFASEDLPHLFERFYRGRDAQKGGIGIGLALSKAILESQNGTVSARNLPEGGACFEVRIYK